MDFLLYVILGFEESSIIHHFCLENEMSFWSPDYFRWRSLLVSGIVSGQGLIFDLTSPSPISRQNAPAGYAIAHNLRYLI